MYGAVSLFGSDLSQRNARVNKLRDREHCPARSSKDFCKGGRWESSPCGKPLSDIDNPTDQFESDHFAKPFLPCGHLKLVQIVIVKIGHTCRAW